MADIKETKELVSWTCQLVNVLGVSLADGKLDLTDLWRLGSVLANSSRALEGADKVAVEFLDLSDAEKAELLALVKTEFDIPQESVEAYVKAAIVAAAKLHDIYLLFKQLRGV